MANCRLRQYQTTFALQHTIAVVVVLIFAVFLNSIGVSSSTKLNMFDCAVHLNIPYYCRYEYELTADNPKFTDVAVNILASIN